MNNDTPRNNGNKNPNPVKNSVPNMPRGNMPRQGQVPPPNGRRAVPRPMPSNVNRVPSPNGVPRQNIRGPIGPQVPQNRVQRSQAPIRPQTPPVQNRPRPTAQNLNRQMPPRANGMPPQNANIRPQVLNRQNINNVPPVQAANNVPPRAANPNMPRADVFENSKQVVSPQILTTNNMSGANLNAESKQRTDNITQNSVNTQESVNLPPRKEEATLQAKEVLENERVNSSSEPVASETIVSNSDEQNIEAYSEEKLENVASQEENAENDKNEVYAESEDAVDSEIEEESQSNESNERSDETSAVDTSSAPAEVVEFSSEKSKKERRIKNQKNKGRSRKKVIGILVAVFVGVIALAGLLYGLSLGNRTYRISFVTGPFEEMEPLTFKDGEFPSVSDLDDIMSLDEEPKPLVEFTGWYLDKDRTIEYRPKALHEDLTLYAGYELGTVTTEFYMINEYDEDGSYIYLSEVETEYYTGEIDFSSLVESITSLDSIYYIAAPNVIGFDPVNFNTQGTKSITIDEYTSFLENYFTISTFTRMDDGSYSVYGVESNIPTPNKDATFYVEFAPNDVSLIFNSNKSSLKDYYDRVGEGSEDFVDSTTTTTVKYGEEYILPSYATISGGVFGEYPEYHSPYGWSIDPDMPIEEGNQNLIYEESDTIKIDKDFLNNQTSIELFALWIEGMTPLVIYTELDDGGPMLETSISVGLSRPLEDWAFDFMDDLNKEGYALLGFNTESDLSGEVVSFEDSINGSVNTPGYDEERGAIVLYAVYKKIVNETMFYVYDDVIDRAQIDELSLNISNFNINLNLGHEKYVYNGEMVLTVHKTGNVIDYITISNLLEGASFTLPNFLRENYTLAGYQNATSNKSVRTNETFTIESRDIDGTSNVILNMIWQGDDYVFVVNNYEGEDGVWQNREISVPYGSTLRFVSSTSNYPDNATTVSIQIYNESTGQMVTGGNFSFVRTGYDFVNWHKYDGENVGDAIDSSFLSSFKVNREFNQISAKWTKKEYTVTFKLAGGNITSGSGLEDVGGNIVIENIEYGDTQSLISNLIERSGYYLSGWALSDVIGAPVVYEYDETEFVVENNTTLFAVLQLMVMSLEDTHLQGLMLQI